MKLRKVFDEARLILIGIPVFLWTMIPVYHLFVLSISPRESVTSGRIWPDHPTLHNFGVVFRQEHFYLVHFWVQLCNSLAIALTVGVLTLIIATCAAFAISRLWVCGGCLVLLFCQVMSRQMNPAMPESFIGRAVSS